MLSPATATNVNSAPSRRRPQCWQPPDKAAGCARASVPAAPALAMQLIDKAEPLDAFDSPQQRINGYGGALTQPMAAPGNSQLADSIEPPVLARVRRRGFCARPTALAPATAHGEIRAKRA